MLSRVARFCLSDFQILGLPCPRIRLASPSLRPGWLFLADLLPLSLRLMLSLLPLFCHQPHFLLLFPFYAGFPLRKPNLTPPKPLMPGHLG